MLPRASLAKKFSTLIGAGMFKDAPYDNHFKTIDDAMWFTAPTVQPTYALFGGMDILTNAVDAYRKEAIKNGKLLPTDEPMCVEDDISLVLMKNNPAEPYGVFVADFRNFGNTNIIMAAALALAAQDPRRDVYKIASPYAGLIVDKTVLPIVEPTELAAVRLDLMQSTITAIEQLAYLHNFKPN